MQGIFSLMMSFESITTPALQRQLLQHSLDLLELSQESAVQLLSHEAESAGELMGLLREHAPVCPQDNHLLMLRGPVQDLVCQLSLAFKRGDGSPVLQDLLDFANKYCVLLNCTGVIAKTTALQGFTGWHKGVHTAQASPSCCSCCQCLLFAAESARQSFNAQ